MLASLGHPYKFQRVLRLSSNSAWHSSSGRQPNFARCLAMSWPGTLYIQFRGILPCDRILPGPKFTLHVVLHSHITARPSSSGRQPNFAASYKEWNYGTFVDGATYVRLGGHHDGHRSTFWLFFKISVNIVRLILST